MRALVAIIFAAFAATAVAQTPQKPELHLHQTYIEETQRATTLDVKDPLAVFAFVLDGLPDHVKVYPTENYFYFTFTHNGAPYAGNIRLDASDRDQGKVQFGYYEQTSGWRDDTPGEFRVLDDKDGVKLEKLERFRYRLTYKAKSVVFELNDLSGVKPPAGALAPSEKFIGPVFDDSGIRFFLVYNGAINNFLYILDETEKVADEFATEPRRDRMLLGKRTGFVFYRDHRLDRKILIGVYEENVRINNYLDGPFDQLPDNFIEGETLREAILKIQPDLKGLIDRFGGAPGGEVRYTIAPYLVYKELDEFGRANASAARRQASEAAYYNCFVFNRDKQNLGAAPPASEQDIKARIRKKQL